MTPEREAELNDRRQRTRDIIRLAKRVYGMRAFAGQLHAALSEAANELGPRTPVIIFEVEGDPVETALDLAEVFEPARPEKDEQCAPDSTDA